MNRAFWFAAGAGATVYAMNRVRRMKDAVTVDGLRDRANGLTLGARLFREEFEQGRVEKETELRERFGLVPHGRPELEAPHAREIVVSTSSTTNGATSSTTNGATSSTSNGTRATSNGTRATTNGTEKDS